MPTSCIHCGGPARGPGMLRRKGKEATEQCGNINGDGKYIDCLSKMSLQHLIFIVVVWPVSVPICVYELWEVRRGRGIKPCRVFYYIENPF